MTESECEPRRLGYARVSTYGQTLDAQPEQLRREGCARVFRENASGAQADRLQQLLRLLKGLAPGDVVTVTRIDCLARSTFDLFAIVKQIVDVGGGSAQLAESCADTANSTGRLMIGVLGGLADVERDLIRTRTAEGQRREGSIWAVLPNLPARRRQRRAAVALKGQPSRNWQTATTWAERRFHGLRYEQCVTAILESLVDVTGDFCLE
jgi:DNA invertase Pin-like site-specific DNA recombinase